MSLSPLATSPPVSSSFDLKLARMSSSPSYGTSPPDQFQAAGRSRRPTKSGVDNVKQLKPFATADIKIRIRLSYQANRHPVLLENVAQTGVDILRKQGYQVRSFNPWPRDILTGRLNSTTPLYPRSSSSRKYAMFKLSGFALKQG
jgi:hypothetical protein